MIGTLDIRYPTEDDAGNRVRDAPHFGLEAVLGAAALTVAIRYTVPGSTGAVAPASADARSFDCFVVFIVHRDSDSRCPVAVWLQANIAVKVTDVHPRQRRGGR